jgi:ubiquinol-cytochrome c reductase iron-sulfur subunit
MLQVGFIFTSNHTICFISVTTQVRFAHTDIQVPDFSAYRRKDVQNNTAISRRSEDARKSFTYLVVGGWLMFSLF